MTLISLSRLLIEERRDKGQIRPGLRLLYEASPMACIVEQAGGSASDPSQLLLHLQPGGLHQRVPVFPGAKNAVERVAHYPLQQESAA